MDLRLDHIALRCNDIEAVKTFFTEIIGLTVGHRPPFPFPGFWLYADEKPVLHLFGGSESLFRDKRAEKKSSPSETSNNVDHIAFWSDDYGKMMSTFRKHNLEFHETVVPGSPMRQIFVNAPENLTVEIDFPTK